MGKYDYWKWRDCVTTPKKKLIEVSLPLEVINRESAREKSIRHGHPSTMHLWWARRPLAAARAVLFSQMVDDPSSNPDEFSTEEAQGAERKRLHEIIERLVVWENIDDADLFEEARVEIRKSNGGELPPVLDPFAGGGTIPLEAQRLGMEAHASDLNPVAVLLNKALIEIPPKFAGRAPVFPGSAEQSNAWRRAEGLAADVRHYGQWIRDEAFERIGHLYPKVKAPGGTEHTVIAWIWARTVRSPNPANPIETPLVRSWWLSKRKGREAHIVPSVHGTSIKYTVCTDASRGPATDEDGTVGRRGAVSLADDTIIPLSYVREQGRQGLLGAHLIAVVAEGHRGRLYVSPSDAQIRASRVDRPDEVPDSKIGYYPRDIKTQIYGMTRWSDLFTNRQLTALTTLTALIADAKAQVLRDAMDSGVERGMPLSDGGDGAIAYSEAVAVYLALATSRTADYSSSLCTWDKTRDSVTHVFSKQAIPMVWDYAETNVFSTSSGNFRGQVEWVAKTLEKVPASPAAQVNQFDAANRDYSGMAVSTDPPYYDNIGYSDLSDYFYVWLRRPLHDVLPDLFGTLLTPKAEELVANQYRHGGRDLAQDFFVNGFENVFARVRDSANASVPLTIYYAYKQQDADTEGTSSTGWHTLLDGLIRTGWEITGTWPIRSELSNRMLSVGRNTLASSIVLVCRPRSAHAEATTRRGFLAALKAELPEALRKLMQGAIAPVDLAQAAIGPGMAVFSRFARVREADGTDMSVRDALLLINGALDEVLNEQESDFDPDTRFAVKWYKQYGWKEASSGIADQLARSSDTSIGALERGGVFEARAGKAKLLAPTTLATDWLPETDDRISIWECAVRLAATMAKDGADAVAALLPAIENRVGLEAVKELGFLLFHEAEKKGDGQDAQLFNGLVSAWSDLTAQARSLEQRQPLSVQQTLDIDED